MTEGMAAAEVLRVLAALHAGGLRAWVAGGWGVDALAGRQTRDHRDLDLALDVTSVSIEGALRVFQDVGYDVQTDWRPARAELAAMSERWVDVHPVVFDQDGTGWQANVEDLPPFRYPPEAFARGTIDGVGIGCLSVKQQLHFHTGYAPRPHDLADIQLLRLLRATAPH